MSFTPTRSVSSFQTRYYDAVVTQFPINDTTRDVEQGGSSANSRPEGEHRACENLSSTKQRYHMEETGSPSRRRDEERQRTPSLRSLPAEPAEGPGKQMLGVKAAPGGAGSVMGRKASVRTTASTHTPTSAFANGAPLVAANAELDVDQGLLARGANAERSLNQKQKDRIAKEEKKDSKKFSKLLKTESTTEKVALDSALKTLSSLQGLHKAAIKREAKAEASHARALSAAQDAEGKFHEELARATELRARAEARCMEERARWEGKEGQVQAQQERLDSARETVKEMETRIAESAREVERLRVVKATDEREREARLIELTGQK